MPSLELDSDVVKVQVASFKKTETEILKGMTGGGSKKAEQPDESPIAKLAEEMKALPARVAERLAESGDPILRRRRMRRFHPMMFEELMHMSGDPSDPVAILMAASVVREDAPWLYELAMEVYRAIKSGDKEAIEQEMSRLHRFSEMGMRTGFMEEFGMGGKESHMFFMEFPRMLEHMLRRTLDEKPQKAARAVRSRSES